MEILQIKQAAKTLQSRSAYAFFFLLPLEHTAYVSLSVGFI